MFKPYSLFMFLLLCGYIGSLSAQQEQKKFTLEEITNGDFYPKSAGYNFLPSEQEDLYSILSSDRKKIELYSFATGKKEKTLLDIDDIASLPEELSKGIKDYLIAPGEKAILLFADKRYIYRRSWKALAYLYNAKNASLTPVYHTSGSQIMNATFSPKGDQLAFVEDNNIYLMDVATTKVKAVTSDGKERAIINGSTDWVYEEEFSVVNTITFSPDAQYLAYVRFDESHVGMYGFQAYTPKNLDDLLVYRYKYPFPGEENSRVEVHLYDTQKEENIKIDLPFDKEDYIPRIDFSPYKNELAVCRLNRHQNDLQVYMVDPTTRQYRVALHETDKAYIANEWINSLVIEPNGFVMVSDRDGFAHIYRFDDKGNKVAQLTKGQFDVKTLYGADKKGNVYYQAAALSPMTRQIFAVDKKGKVRQLACERGTNDASFSRNFAYMLLSRNHADMPPVYTIVRTKDAHTLRTLEDNKHLRNKLAQYRYNPREFTKVTTPEGLTFNAFVLKPSHFDPNKKYPILMMQYSGPDSQEVLDRYNIDWTYALVEEGFIVVSVDGRGTGARGADWRKCTYMKLGLLESDDQIAAAKAIAQWPFVDGKRIALWGWSFGGYNTLLSMCRSEGVFKAGIAIAPVTDWHFYDTVYTERFLRTPQENPEGYNNGSPLRLAKNFNGKLLLIHGTADDNVHLRNGLLFSEELVQAGIPFEMAIYPNRNHSIYGGNTRHHLYQRNIDFLKRNL